MIERCTDYRRIKKLASREMVISSEVYYLMEGDRGLWTFEPFLDGLAIHADMGPLCRGRSAVQSARSAFTWVFENTAYDKIYATIPNDKRAAQMVASFSGMQFVEADEGHRGYLITKGAQAWAA